MSEIARIDKYDPKVGGFRAPLAADWSTLSAVRAVGLDANGRVVAGAGNSGVVGALILTADKKAGDVVDVMTRGEVVEFGGAAGTTYYASTVDGTTGTSPDLGGAAGSGAGHHIGWTVEADRLIVSVGRPL